MNFFCSREFPHQFRNTPSMCKAYTSHKAFFCPFWHSRFGFAAASSYIFGTQRARIRGGRPRLRSANVLRNLRQHHRPRERERERSAATDTRCGRRPPALFGALPVEVIFAGSLFSARCRTAIVSVCKIVADRPRAVNDMSSKVSRVV